MSESREYASVDLGSNSFHLVLARMVDDELHVVDKLKERVRLAAGLTSKNNLTADIQQKALECLERFGHRLAHLPKDRVRVVGTNTLRKAKNVESFLAKAESCLGQKVEIISGLEEARLIYLGVQSSLPKTSERRLIVDIGGGSTECIVGQEDDIVQADSFYMGCVEFTTRYFSKAKWSRSDFEKAVTAARLQVGPIQRKYKSLDWTNVYGSSGTISAIGDILRMNHFGPTITRSGIDWLYGYMQGARSLDSLELDGLKPDRAPVFVGGVCILWALFHSLKIKAMVPVATALREGVLCELADVASHADIRERSVTRMVKRFSADSAHAQNVRSVIRNIGPQLLNDWGIELNHSLKILDWSAQLHEIGKSIQYSGYHKHSAYLVKNSHLAGFSRQEQNTVAAILLCQRRKIEHERIRALVGQRAAEVAKMSVILRLAVLLCRTRSKRPRPQVSAAVEGGQVVLTFPPGYLDDRPLTKADLEQESGLLQPIGLRLQVEEPINSE